MARIGVLSVNGDMIHENGDFNINSLSGLECSYEKIVDKYGLSMTEFGDLALSHSVTHHLTTAGPPIYLKPCHLDSRG